MTTTTNRRRAAAIWTGLCLAAGIGIATHMDIPQGEVTTAAVSQESTEDLATADRMLIAQAGELLPDTDLTVDQAREVIHAADRVCDRLDLGDNAMDIAIEIGDEEGLDGVTAHDFVRTVAWEHCQS
jgi:hypothetical protein